MTPCWAAGLQQNISGWRPTNFLSNFELKKHAGAEVRHSKKKPHPQLCWLSGKGGTSGLLSKIVYSSLHRAFKSLELCACSWKYSASWGKRGKGRNDKCLAVTLHELHTVPGTGTWYFWNYICTLCLEFGNYCEELTWKQCCGFRSVRIPISTLFWLRMGIMPS